MELNYIPLSVIRAARKLADPAVRNQVLAAIFRINILYMIRKAGSGHIGTSFSSIDIMTAILFGMAEGEGVFFSSKGHDAPGYYAVLAGLEKIDFDLIHRLRSIEGLPGHPDIKTPGVVANTGSLGMGISKARGMAIANRLMGKREEIFVMTGDGELQEGQIWESLQSVANGKFSEITVIIDHNKLQSDIYVRDVNSLGNLCEKLRAFGWVVREIDGHDSREILETLNELSHVLDQPKIIVAHTIKGKGVSFMEPSPVYRGEDTYRYHSGAPSIEDYKCAFDELHSDMSKLCETNRVPFEITKVYHDLPMPPTGDRLVDTYGKTLAELAKTHPEIVVFDGDLMLDCGLIPFRSLFPERFIECGIAEQDMVSTAGGLALKGMLPIVHSFACFLTTRPNEQIYNNATELTKIIYVGSLAGILPSAPGHSHQSVRDIALMGSMPGMTLIQPYNSDEVKSALRWAVEEHQHSTYLRLVTVPTPTVSIQSGSFEHGKGNFLKDGRDIAIIGYGPTLLNQALLAADKVTDLSVAVINLPWLNYVDEYWLREICHRFSGLVLLDDHYVESGQSILLAAQIQKVAPRDAMPTIKRMGLVDIPACGRPSDVLAHHHLNAEAIADMVISLSRVFADI